jgi:hypothetical protein
VSAGNEQAECVYCGAVADLVADEEIETLWYCRRCLARRDEHRDLIAGGCDADDPSYE